MFWGLVLKANRKYTQKIKKGFHVSHAALDLANSSEDPVHVILTSENQNYILCTLKKNKTEQVSLDLNFAEGDEISFTSQGNGNVHLTGYLIPEADEDLDFLGEEESEDEELQSQPVKKKKQQKESKANTSAKKSVVEQEDEDDDEDDSDLDESGGEVEEDGEDDDDDDEDEEGEDESSSDEEVTEPKPKQMKFDTSKQNGLENGKVQSKEKQKKDKKQKQQQKQQQQSEKTPKGGEKTLQGGVKVEDIRVGNGPEAKSGRKVQVYYEGRLKSNNKVFDSSKTGPGFKFGLGRGEVIKAWDIGVVGMKVGGKRRIICPPSMAYGAKGSPPVIPPNSTLVFEVELKNVN